MLDIDIRDLYTCNCIDNNYGLDTRQAIGIIQTHVSANIRLVDGYITCANH